MKDEFLYFDLHGIGIVRRLAMTAGGIRFKDTRVSFPKGWQEVRKSTTELLTFLKMKRNQFFPF